MEREWQRWLKTFQIALITLGMTQAIYAVDVNFNNDPGWTGSGNTAQGNNFGYSPTTNFANGPQGEVGGTFARTSTEVSYGDTHLSSKLTLDNKISASGLFDVHDVSTANQEFFVGHYSASTTDRSMLGMEFMEDSDGSVRVRARINRPDTFGGADGPAIGVPINGNYHFEYTYDPSLGDHGRITLHIFDNSLSFNQTISADLTDSERALGGTFDSFGVGITAGAASDDDASHTAKLYIDDVSYTGFRGAN